MSEAYIGSGSAESARKALKSRGSKLDQAEKESMGESQPYEKAPDWGEKKGRAEGGKVGTKPKFSFWPGSK